MAVFVNDHGSLQCNHEDQQRLCKRTLSNHTIAYCVQCLDCGQQVGKMIAKASLSEMMVRFRTTRIEEWDEGITQDWTERWRATLADKRQSESDEFWDRYEEHMQSERWQDLRRLVFKRCNYVCEGCGEKRVVQVHHLTYKRLGNEMLFDLVAVCIDCHQVIHPNRNFGGGS